MSEKEKEWKRAEMYGRSKELKMKRGMVFKWSFFNNSIYKLLLNIEGF